MQASGPRRVSHVNPRQPAHAVRYRRPRSSPSRWSSRRRSARIPRRRRRRSIRPSHGVATVEVSTRGTITAKLIATIRADITCEPFEMFDWETGETDSVHRRSTRIHDRGPAPGLRPHDQLGLGSGCHVGQCRLRWRDRDAGHVQRHAAEPAVEVGYCRGRSPNPGHPAWTSPPATSRAAAPWRSSSPSSVGAGSPASARRPALSGAGSGSSPRRCGRCSSGRRRRCASRGRPRAPRTSRNKAISASHGDVDCARDPEDRAVALLEPDRPVGADDRDRQVALLVLDDRELADAVLERRIVRQPLAEPLLHLLRRSACAARRTPRRRDRRRRPPRSRRAALRRARRSSTGKATWASGVTS